MIYCEAKGLLPEELCGFRTRRLTLDMLSAVRGPHTLGQKARVPLFLCLIGYSKCKSAPYGYLLPSVSA